MRILMIDDDEIYVLLLANVTSRWRKMAYVVGVTMMQIDPAMRTGKDDLYFATLVVGLINKGLLEYTGDLSNMRKCEGRLSSKFYQPGQ